jgi:hypothetical protein
MKKFFKISLITVASLLILTLAVISIVLWFVFTPEKLTPIVRKQASKYITCKTEIGQVELTFFSTFPSFGLKANHVTLVNPVKGAVNDTLINADEIVGVVDVAAWWNKKELVITDFLISDGSIHLFSDSLGHTNYDIVALDTTASDTATSEAMFRMINLSNVEINHVNLSYVDQSLKFITEIKGLDANVSGSFVGDTVSSVLNVSRSLVALEYDGEKYLQDASVTLEIPSKVNLSQWLVDFKDALITVNDLELSASGTVKMNENNDDIMTDITYQLKDWPVKHTLALTPPSYTSYLKDLDADGKISSNGHVKGIYNDSLMPLMDVHLLLDEGAVNYKGFPIAVSGIKGDVDLYSDLTNDSLSYVRINHFEAKTPQSVIETKGLIDHLFSDIHCNLTSVTEVVLDEFAPVIPANLKMKLKGKAQGTVKSDFSLVQLEKMQIDKMNYTGNLTVTGLDVTYDSLTLKSDRSNIIFTLPNHAAAGKNRGFVFAKMDANKLEASKLKGYQAMMRNAHIELESSDVRDTLKIPNVYVTFKMDTLSASMDTITVDVSRPAGTVALQPRYSNVEQPRIIANYNNRLLHATMGKESYMIGKTGLEADVVYDKTQKDLFQQWLVKGFVEMENGTFNLTSLTKTIDVPSVKMDFEPETFNIKEGRVKIDKSDFQLSGSLHNILSYFRGDSVLRGDFNLSSSKTDVGQLMNLTNGIGSETVDTSAIGPYMVPKGIDVNLRANVKEAVLGLDTALNVAGGVRIKDGLLVLDALMFKTPAAKIQLTGMYRTPRRNHLFAGFDYHMTDVNLEELPKMIPDLDSIMPMLRSFKGKGEFHMAVETYLDSLYNIKKSTLRGVSSIKGQNLVLMDGETFSQIAKTLMFNKKTENKIDSLSAEFTIFKKEVDIYPFLVVMDKYKAVVAGRHNLDMSFNYHISVVDSPLPVKLGVDVSGTIDDLKYKLVKCKYAEFYRPSSRKMLENKQLELRKMIRDALVSNLKE